LPSQPQKEFPTVAAHRRKCRTQLREFQSGTGNTGVVSALAAGSTT
jgi:hypothetical protein